MKRSTETKKRSRQRRRRLGKGWLTDCRLNGVDEMQRREKRFNNATTTPSGSTHFKIKASDRKNNIYIYIN